ncbi:ZIP family metal transporter [Clostridium sp. CX1]|uniref:ZIP family metal transporter n=1 Tax=Clostridium tanneri TaxID=3037988 RepID=A0ABU4JR86_9CLOT|nr:MULTISPECIES: ZIP family metal transporter [unclassified Clostridium]MCT8975796.1 ZIP family metal transporter [Clostridium sp. CX1]MDW8800649.1 ZIP family metal transporter [Clostridium sp. A1-XYC3]
MDGNMIGIVVIGSTVSLVGTMIGASLGVIVKKPSNKLLGSIIGFAGGLMLAVVVFDLIPEALNEWSFGGTLFFCLMGIIVIAIIDNKINIDTLNQHVKVAFMAALGLMIHNFPEGVIMGCGFAAGGTLGIKMSLIIAIHDIPEGIAVSAPLMASRVRVSKILLYAFITAFPTALGTWLGAYIANISQNILGACLSFASGIMLYVVCGEMIPESSRLWEGVTSTIGVLSGIIIGLTMVKLI